MNVLAPPESETAHVASAGRVGGHEQVDERIVRDDSGTDKRFCHQRAVAALAGHELHRHDDGGFEARRWGWSRRFADLDAVADFLASITGKEVT